MSLLGGLLAVVLGAVTLTPAACGSDSGSNGRGTGGAGGAADAGADSQLGDPGMVAVNRPEQRPVTDALVASLRVPSGFRVDVFARDLTNPRMMVVDATGAVWVTVPSASEVLRLADGNGDGDAADPGEKVVAASKDDSPLLDGVHGITLHEGKMYLASIKAVFSATPGADGRLGDLTKLADLPDGGQHPRRTLAVGPDGALYVTVGSTCNACPEPNSEHATFLRLELGGSASANPANPQHPVLAANPEAMVSPRVFASGLRNTLGFDWHPSTGALWGADHGSDGLGDDRPFDEINHVEGGKAYGWPYCWGEQQIDPAVDDPSPAMSKETYCPTTEAPLGTFPAHSAPIAFLFYRGNSFPAAYHGDAFVALRGSWNRSVPTGYKVVRVRFADGMPGAIEDFLSGFLIEGGAAHFGRPAGLAVDATGALLVSEDTNGVIYRVTATGGGGAGGPGGGGAGGNGGAGG